MAGPQRWLGEADGIFYGSDGYMLSPRPDNKGWNCVSRFGRLIGRFGSLEEAKAAAEHDATKSPIPPDLMDAASSVVDELPTLTETERLALIARTLHAERERCAQFAFAHEDWPARHLAMAFRGQINGFDADFFAKVKRGEVETT